MQLQSGRKKSRPLNLPTLSASAAPCPPPPPPSLAITSRSRRTIWRCVARWLLRCGGGEVVVVLFAVFLADETGAIAVIAGRYLGDAAAVNVGRRRSGPARERATRWSEISALRGRRASERCFKATPITSAAPVI